jgi:lipopolysaccharide export system permease protein
VSLLDRYLAREILLPFAAGLLFLTQVLLATQVLAQGDVLLGSGVSAIDVLLVALDLTPHLLGYVLPVSFLLGCVLGVGRLAEDRELVALGAAGVSPARLVKVPLLVGLGAAAVALWLSLGVEPAGLRAARLRLDEVVKKNVSADVRPGVFYEEIPGLTLYAEQVSGGIWRHVLISDHSDPRAPLLALADGGRLETAPGETMRLVLQGGELHREEAGAGDYVIASFARASLAVGLGGALGERNRLTGSPFELRAEEIVALADERGARDPEEGRRWRAFLHRRIAGPAGVLAFALLAVPIGASRRGGRAFGYAATLLSVIGYYAVMRLGEGLAQRGVLAPWLGPHLGNVVGAVAGILAVILMSRRGAGAVR